MNKDQQRKRDQIMHAYHALQNRQIVAIAAALFLVLLLAAAYKRPDVFGSFDKTMLFTLQAFIIALFIGFTAWNWRCPSCRAFLANDISRRQCRRCGARLQ